MNYTLMVISGFTVGIPALIGLIRFRKIDPVYYPFIFLLWLGLANETFSYFLLENGYGNAVNTNVYALFESLLILWFFRKLGLFERSGSVFYLILIFFLTAWTVDNFILSSITQFSSYFFVAFSFIVVLMSISMINILMLRTKSKLIRNPVFLVCIGFILYFTYSVLVEVFWIYGLDSSREFRRQVYRILIYINIFVNLIYTLAVLWMPAKREYTLL